MNRTLVALTDLECLASVMCLQHGVALILQDLTHDCPDGLFIFYQKDGFRPPGWHSGGCFRSVCFDGLLDAWQVYLERCPLPQLAISPDVSSALFDNPIHRGQAQTASLPCLFRGEEGLKEVR